MSNPLFDMFGGNKNIVANIMSMLPNFKNNPLGALQSAGFNIPNNISNPQEIVRYLVQSGQINQGQLDYAQKMAKMLGL